MNPPGSNSLPPLAQRLVQDQQIRLRQIHQRSGQGHAPLLATAEGTHGALEQLGDAQLLGREGKGLEMATLAYGNLLGWVIGHEIQHQI